MLLQGVFVLWLTECIYCSNFVYHLSDGRLKCYKCHKKISKNKINKIITLIDAFVNNESALHTSKRLQISYSSVQKHFVTFRTLCGIISEDEYQNIQEKVCEFEEYFYVEKSKKHTQQNNFDAINFLTFDYDKHIYTLLLPSFSKYQTDYMSDESFKKFKRESKLIKVTTYHNNIEKFWRFLETNLLHYKGIDKTNFAYFLKEMEFKYNHTKKEAKELLIKEYFKI